jgi:hypothetical protein
MPDGIIIIATVDEDKITVETIGEEEEVTLKHGQTNQQSHQLLQHGKRLAEPIQICSQHTKMNRENDQEYDLQAAKINKKGERVSNAIEEDTLLEIAIEISSVNDVENMVMLVPYVDRVDTIQIEATINTKKILKVINK